MYTTTSQYKSLKSFVSIVKLGAFILGCVWYGWGFFFIALILGLTIEVK